MNRAKEYFIELGFQCPDRATTADFLTSLTSPIERIFRDGYEHSAPRTAAEFAVIWKNSSERKQLLREIAEFTERYPVSGQSEKLFAV